LVELGIVKVSVTLSVLLCHLFCSCVDFIPCLSHSTFQKTQAYKLLDLYDAKQRVVLWSEEMSGTSCDENWKPSDDLPNQELFAVA